MSILVVITRLLKASNCPYMTNRYLVYILSGLWLLTLSACSSCNSTEVGSSNTTSYSYSSSQGNEGLYRTEEERLQAAINDRITEQVTVSRNITSHRVQNMIAGFKMGMSRREVQKHFLRMKQKKHLVRIKVGQRKGSSKTHYAYVYRLPLASGRSNMTFDFKHKRKGGVYKLICQPQQLRKLKKNAFVEEIRTLLEEWYGAYDFKLPNVDGCGRYVWIAGNHHLDLYATPMGVEFVYTDLQVEIPPNIEGGGEERPLIDLPS